MNRLALWLGLVLYGWPPIAAVEMDMLTARIATLMLAPLLYSLYELSTAGTSLKYWPYSYALLFGSLLSVGGAFALSYAVDFRGRQDLSARKRLVLSFCAFSGFFPYLFGVYLVAFAGLYGLYVAITAHSVARIVASVLWILIGYRLAWVVRIMSEAGVA
jgi:hypothetical protein